MPSLTQFALNNSRVVIMTMVLIVFSGLYLYQDFPKLEDPSIIIREAVVIAQYPGMPPERVERLITRPIEEKIRTMGEVDDIENSTSKFGESLIHVTIKDEVPAEQLPATWKLLRNKMNDLAPSLPMGTIGPMVNDEFGDTAVATIALWSDGFSMAEMYEAARHTRELLSTMEGIKKITLSGVQDERIYLNLSNARLAQLGINPQVLKTTLQEQNVILPSGKMDIEGSEITIESSGRFQSIDEIGAVLIPVPGTQRQIPLRDLATIEQGYVDPPVKPAYFNGHQAIVLSVFLLDQVNAVGFGERLTRKLNEIEQGMPWGYRFEYATYQPELIEQSVKGMVLNVIETVIIVLVVVVLFLGLRTGVIVGTFVPLVMLFGVVMMSFLDIEMQRMSLASMIIALGMLVDNGIVVAEDIRTRMEQGTERKEAVLQAGSTLMIPLLTSTLTTVLAFAPMLLMEGSTGDYTKSLGQVVTILLLGSWFFSMVVTTSSCNWFMKIEPPQVDSAGRSPDPYHGRFYKAYRMILQSALRHRLLVLVVVFAALGTALYGFRFVTQSFFPAGDRNQFLIYVDLPAGTRIEETDRTAQAVAAWLEDNAANPEITGTIAYVGDGGPRFFLSLNPDDPDPHLGFIIVNTESSEQVPELVMRTRAHLLDHFPNVRGRVKAMWLGSSETGLLEVRLSGPEIDVLQQQAQQLMAALRAVPGTIDIKQDWDNLTFKVQVDVDQARARRAGLNSLEVAQSLEAFVFGKTLSDYWAGDIEVPIVARGNEEERTSLAKLNSLGIYSREGNDNVPLSQIADIYGVGEYSRIKRYNQVRSIAVSAKNEVLSAGQLLAAIQPTLNTMEFPPNHFWALGAELEDSADAQASLAKWFPPCFLMIILLLVWQFNSFRRAGIILITIPLIFIGAVVGMLVMRADFGFMVILGLLSLAGTIINNGIVLIDRIETLRNSGSSPYDAVVGSAISRFRPILMSVTTTVLGLLPLMLSKDPLFYGMACVMAWGLAIGTVFTLGVVPVLYTLFFRIAPPKLTPA